MGQQIQDKSIDDHKNTDNSDSQARIKELKLRMLTRLSVAKTNNAKNPNFVAKNANDQIRD